MSSKQTNLSISKDNGQSFNVPKVLYENRYCNLVDFSILIWGGRTQEKGVLNNIYELKVPNFECTKFTSMLEARYFCKTAVINSDILAIGGYNKAGERLYSVEMLKNDKQCFFKFILYNKMFLRCCGQMIIKGRYISN